MLSEWTDHSNDWKWNFRKWRIHEFCLLFFCENPKKDTNIFLHFWFFVFLRRFAQISFSALYFLLFQVLYPKAKSFFFLFCSGKWRWRDRRKKREKMHTWDIFELIITWKEWTNDNWMMKLRVLNPLNFTRQSTRVGQREYLTCCAWPKKKNRLFANGLRSESDFVCTCGKPWSAKKELFILS